MFKEANDICFRDGGGLLEDGIVDPLKHTSEKISC
jgi:hypothetical protein